MCKSEGTNQPSNIPSKIRSRRCMVVREKEKDAATEESSDIASLDPLEQLIFEEIARKKKAETNK